MGPYIGWIPIACFLIAAAAWSEKFVGSKNSHKYHYTSFKWAQKIKPGNIRSFASPGEAQAKGFQPCRVCRPPAK